jgi:hypothetical protein
MWDGIYNRVLDWHRRVPDCAPRVKKPQDGHVIFKGVMGSGGK